MKMFSTMSFTPTWIMVMVATVANISSADGARGTFSSYNTIPVYCPHLNPQTLIDLELITGKWYVVEVVKHKIDPSFPMNSGRFIIDFCPVVRIHLNGRNLRLLWTEELGNIDYSFTVHDLNTAPGLWTTKVPQNGNTAIGTLLSRQYIQNFMGNVQVMKAVASHMVLTFCSKTPDNLLFTILLSRQHRLEKNDSAGVEKLLSRRGLAIVNVQESCINSGSRNEGSTVARWLMLLLVTALATYSTTTTATTFAF